MKSTIQQRKKLIESNTDASLFPAVINKAICIGEYRISLVDDRYEIRSDCLIFPIGKTYTLLGAVALVKDRIKRRDRKNRICYHDRELYYRKNDVIHFHHLLKHSVDEQQRDIVSMRLEHAQHCVDVGYRILYDIVFG